MSIAERIKAARKAAGLTQKELGVRMSISDASVAQYESGKRRPKIETLQRIASALDISLANLVDSPLIQQMDVVDSMSLPDIELKEVLKQVLGHFAIEADVLTNRAAVIEQLSKYLERLNARGQAKALERIEELTQIPKYRAKPYE